MQKLFAPNHRQFSDECIRHALIAMDQSSRSFSSSSSSHDSIARSHSGGGLRRQVMDAIDRQYHASRHMFEKQKEERKMHQERMMTRNLHRTTLTRSQEERARRTEAWRTLLHFATKVYLYTLLDIHLNDSKYMHHPRTHKHISSMG
jgi:hypothetical protein